LPNPFGVTGGGIEPIGSGESVMYARRMFTISPAPSAITGTAIAASTMRGVSIGDVAPPVRFVPRSVGALPCLVSRSIMRLPFLRP
jgi:hypothetical protein